MGEMGEMAGQRKVIRRKRRQQAACCGAAPRGPACACEEPWELGANCGDMAGPMVPAEAAVRGEVAMVDSAESVPAVLVRSDLPAAEDWGAAIAAAKRLGAPKVKREEGEPWSVSELILRRGIQAQLLTDGWTPEELATHPSINMLKTIRCMWDRPPRFARTYARYVDTLEWRRDNCRDKDLPHEAPVESLLTAPTPLLAQQMQMWLDGWKNDYYGTDQYGHPIMVWQLGRMDPATFLEDFTVPQVNTNFIRDLEYIFRWMRTKRGIYKMVVVLDFAGVGWRHFVKKFRDPTIEIVKMLQLRYPDGVHRVIVVNAGLFATAWRVFKTAVDPNTRENITMLGSNPDEWERVFGERGISMDQLPPWVGGTADPNSGMMREYASRGNPAFPPFDPAEDCYNSQMIGALGKESQSEGIEEEDEDEIVRLYGTTAKAAAAAQEAQLVCQAIGPAASKNEGSHAGWSSATMSFVQDYGFALTASSVGLVIVQSIFARCFSISGMLAEAI